MALIEFKNKPNTDTPINDDNLNHNFKELLNLITDLKKGLDYSQEEQVVGFWVDGKPLYRKAMIFNDTINNTSENSFAHNIENAKFVRVKEAHLYNFSTGRSLPLPITLYNSNTNFDHVNIEADRTYVKFFVASGWAGWYKVVILEYTKTTD